MSKLERISEGSEERDTRSPSEKSSLHSISIVKASSDGGSSLTDDARKRQLLSEYAGRVLGGERQPLLEVPSPSVGPSSPSLHSSDLSSLTEPDKSPSGLATFRVDLRADLTRAHDHRRQDCRFNFQIFWRILRGRLRALNFQRILGGLPSQDRGDSVPSREELSRLQGEIAQEYTHLRNVLSQSGRDLTDEHRQSGRSAA